MTKAQPKEHAHAARIAESVKTVYDLDEQFRSAAPAHEQTLDRVARALGGHAFLAVVFVATGAWVLANLLLRRAGWTMLDAPPFFWLQGTLSFTALLISILVLTRQEQQRRFDERRAHLDLQVNLLAEQKIAKLIGLLEELRRDMPDVRDRHDSEASTMAAPTDPADVLAGLEPALDLAAYRKR
jgi:uncharacterized membrane protein